MLDVRRMRLLVEVASRGTIAAAAQALSFTPSAVSQQLAVLEREAGVALLERDGRRVMLTRAGWAVVRHAEAIMERLEQVTAELATTETELSGPLRIGAYPSAARAVVPAAIARLAALHPRLEPMVEEIDPADVAEQIRAGRLDAALVNDYDLVPTMPDPAIDGTALFDEPMYLAAPASRPVGDPADPIAAADELPWIVGRPDTLCHDMAVRACQAAGYSPRIRHYIDDYSTVLALVAVGQGVALIPGLAAADPPAGVKLTRLGIHRRTRLAYRRGAAGHPAIRALVEAMEHSRPPGPG